MPLYRLQTDLCPSRPARHYTVDNGGTILKEFRDKVAVITGAASGIGRGLAERCAQEGIGYGILGISAEGKVRLRLGAGMAEEIVAHSREGYPEEVCGIVSGRDGVAHTLYRGRNVSPTPRVAYELDVETLARQIAFADEGLTMVAIYHSHPAGPETPSGTDRKRAFYPDSVYLVCSLADPARPVLRGFCLWATGWEEVTLEAAAQCARLLDAGPTIG